MENQELRSTEPWKKNLLERLNDRFELAEERIYELENGSVEIMKQEQREKRMKKINLTEIQNNSKYANICIVRVPQGKKKERSRRNIWRKAAWNLKILRDEWKW